MGLPSPSLRTGVHTSPSFHRTRCVMECDAMVTPGISFHIHLVETSHAGRIAPPPLHLPETPLQSPPPAMGKTPKPTTTTTWTPILRTRERSRTCPATATSSPTLSRRRLSPLCILKRECTPRLSKSPLEAATALMSPPPQTYTSQLDPRDRPGLPRRRRQRRRRRRRWRRRRLGQRQGWQETP